MDEAALNTVSPSNGIDRDAKHTCDAAECVAGADSIDRNSGCFRQSVFKIGRGSGWSVLRKERESADHRDIASTDGRSRINVNRRGKEWNSLRIVIRLCSQ